MPQGCFPVLLITLRSFLILRGHSILPKRRNPEYSGFRTFFLPLSMPSNNHSQIDPKCLTISQYQDNTASVPCPSPSTRRLTQNAKKNHNIRIPTPPVHHWTTCMPSHNTIHKINPTCHTRHADDCKTLHGPYCKSCK